MSSMSAERSSCSQLSREKKADCAFPAAIRCAPAGHALSVPVISRFWSRCCWGTAAIEIAYIYMYVYTGASRDNFSSESTIYLSSSEEDEVVSRDCWAVAAPIMFQLLIWETSLLILPRILESEWRSRAEGFHIRLQRQSWCPWPRTYEGRSLWGRAGYTALHGARLSSVPSGDRSTNPASVPGRSGLQRALLSVSPARKRSGTERLATPSGVFRAARVAVPCRSSASGHWASSSKH